MFCMVFSPAAGAGLICYSQLRSHLQDSRVAMLVRRLIFQLSTVLVLGVLLLSASACGQKGDLYLPDDTKTQRKK